MDIPKVSAKSAQLSTPNLKPWFLIGCFANPNHLQNLLDLSSPPTLLEARLTSYCPTEIWPGTFVLLPAPSTVFVSGSAFFPTSTDDVVFLENCAIGKLEVRDARMDIWRGWRREEVEGRAVVYMGGQKALEREVAECKVEREVRDAKWKENRYDERGAKSRIWEWLGGVQEGEWEGDRAIDWEKLSRDENERGSDYFGWL